MELLGEGMASKIYHINQIYRRDIWLQILRNIKFLSKEMMTDYGIDLTIIKQIRRVEQRRDYSIDTSYLRHGIVFPIFLIMRVGRLHNVEIIDTFLAFTFAPFVA